MFTEKTEKTGTKYTCDACVFCTSDKKDYKRHLSTLKHKIAENVDECSVMFNPKKKFQCECGKMYSYKQSLNVHKKKCIFETKIVCDDNEIEENNINKTNQELILELLEQNKQLQQALINVIPNIGNNNNSHNTVNNKLNIQIFLNENCKDAMSLGDFINGICVDTENLILTREKGQVEGISNILVKHLNMIPIYQRPLWCSDKKRKKLYIKEDVWKEDKDNVKTKEAIYNVSKIQTRNITKFISDKPNWMQNDRQKDEYMHIVKAVTDPMENKIDKVLDKIIDDIHFNETNIKE